MDYLFVIDYQKDFVDGTLGFPGAEKLDAGIAARVREYGPGRVYYTQDTHFENYLSTREGRGLPIAHCIRGTEGWENYGETAKALAEVGAVGIEKKTFGMDLSDPEILEKLPADAENIELCGLVSNICVLSNAAVLQGHYTEAHLIVDATLTASNDPALNEACLEIMGKALQVEIRNR